MATKKTCICIGDLEERRKEITCAIDIVEALSRSKGYWMTEDEKTGALIPFEGEETRVRLYNEVIKFVIENYG